MTDELTVLKTSLAERLSALRGVPVEDLPAELLDIAVRPVDLPGGPVYIVRPADFEALRDEEGMAPGQPLPYWARLWPSASLLALELAARPPGPGTRVLELGCGLGLPSVVAARGGLVVVAVGMGVYLSAATLNQAALAQGRARQACLAWACTALAFVAYLAIPWGFHDKVLQVELGYFGAASLLCTLLYLLYRRPVEAAVSAA